MEGLFGAAAGSRLFDMDQLKFREDARQEQELVANTEYKRAMAAAANRNATTEADKLARARQLEAIAAGAAGNQAPTTPADQISQLYRVSQALIRAGEPGEGSKLLNTAAQIVQRTEAAAASSATAAKAEFERAQKVMGELQQTVLGVRSQSELDAARLTWQAAYPDEPFPEELKTYNPATIQRFVVNSKAWLDNQKLQLDQANSKSLRDARAARKAYMEGALKDRQERTKIYRESEARQGAANGMVENRPVGAAPQNYVATTLTALKDAKLLVNDEEEQIRQSRSIADDAWVVHQRNPAKSWAAALQEAIQNAKDRGEIEQNVTDLGITSFNRNKFSPKMGSAARPLPEPPDPNAELMPNTHYQRPDGSIFLVTKGPGGKLTAKPIGRPGKPFGPKPPPAEVDNPLNDDEEE